MFSNYLKIAWRSILKQRGYALLNIAGLVCGLASCLLMVLYVHDEFGFDRFHARGERIYRVPSEFNFNNRVSHSPYTSMALATHLATDVPEIESVIRIKRLGGPVTIVRGKEAFYEERFLFADPTFFTVFSFPLMEGTPGEVLHEPFTVVLTKKLAGKYFYDTNPIGEMIEMHWGDTSALFRVVGIARDVQANSSVQFDLVASLSSALQTTSKGEQENWLGVSSLCFVELRSGAEAGALHAKLSRIVTDHAGEKAFYKPYLQPLTDIHLNRLGLGVPAESDVRYVYIFGALAAVLLIIACMNYTNLATARAATRLREIGVRKVLGAARKEIATQFLIESVLSSLIAFSLSMIVVELLLPAFNALVEKSIELQVSKDPVLIGGLLLIGLLTGVLSGYYPALFLSRFQPIGVLQPSIKGVSSQGTLRRVLVVTQFTASIALVVGTIVIQQQLNFIREKKLGFDREQVVVVPFRELAVVSRAARLEKELAKLSGVLSTALGSPLPAKDVSRNGIRLPGDGGDGATMMPSIAVDFQTVSVLGLDLKEGRWFSEARPSDERDGFVINEAAARALGLSEPVGTPLQRNEQKGIIIGMVGDFHFRPLHHPIEPVVFYIDKGRSPFWMYLYTNIMVKVRPNAMEHTLSEMEIVWKNVYPDKPFEFSFLDENIQEMYGVEQRFGSLFTGFAFIAVATACLGLFGLAAFDSERRTKEIGVRKVLGASVNGIVILLSREFLLLVVLADLIALPLSHGVMGLWLREFAYRIEIGPEIFLVATCMAIVIAMTTVSIQAIRAGLANPVEALRYE